MIIDGNKNITGIFKYAEDAKFVEGDFVVSGDTIYTVKKGTTPPAGTNVTNTDYYEPYMSESLATVNDVINNKKYYEQTSDSSFKSGKIYYTFDGTVYTQTSDSSPVSGTTYYVESPRYVTPSLISSIFDSYMSGFGYDGVIRNSISSNGTVVITNYLGGIISSNVYTDPLDTVLTSDSLNNAIFTVSKDLVKNISSLGISDGLLRQYTYYSGTTRIRIQELIDIDKGLLYYRYKKGSSSASSWKSSVVNTSVSTTMNELVNQIHATTIHNTVISGTLNNTTLTDQLTIGDLITIVSSIGTITVKYSSDVKDKTIKYLVDSSNYISVKLSSGNSTITPNSGSVSNVYIRRMS